MTSADQIGLPDLLADAAENCPDHGALIDGERTTTYGGYASWVAVVSERMRAMGVRRGDRVAILLPNCSEFCVAVLAAAQIGAIAVLLNPRYTQEELSFLIGDSDPSLVVTARDTWADLEAWDGFTGLCASRAGFHGILAVRATSAALEPGRRVSEFPDGPPPSSFAVDGQRGLGKDAAIIIYTSGTTGRPKGAVLSHANVISSVRGYARRLRVAPEDRLSVLTPMCHAGGLINGVFTALWARCTAVIGDRLTPDAALQILRDQEVTVYLAVPTMLIRQLEQITAASPAVPRLRAIVTGGSPVQPELARRAQEAFGQANLHVVYGLSEANMVTLTGAGDLAESHQPIVGCPTDSYEVKVIDPRGEDLPAGVSGEIMVRGGGVFAGYWSDPEATQARIDDSGWLHTGDLGYRTEQGDLVIAGRLTDMYIQGGTNIYPAEIERVLELHPDVAFAAVVGQPDPVLGEVGCAFVVPASGRTVDEARLLEHAAKMLAPFKLPREIRVRDALPMTAFGKIKKAELKAELAAEQRQLLH